MFTHFPRVLEQIQSNLTDYLQVDTVVAAFRQAGLSWRKRVLDLLTTLRLFVLQILNGNIAIAGMKAVHIIGDQPFIFSRWAELDC